MTPDELDRLDAVHAAMTPGQWRSNIQWLHGDAAGIGPWSRAGYACAEDGTSADCSQAWRDGDGIAALHNDYPALSAALRAAWRLEELDITAADLCDRLERRVAELEAELAHQKHIVDSHVEARRMLADDIVALGTGKPTKLELSRGADNRIDRLAARLAKAVELLRPFAEINSPQWHLHEQCCAAAAFLASEDAK